MRNIEEDIYSLWSLLLNNGMIGSVKQTDSTGKEKMRYFLNDYGKQIMRLLIERYKLGSVEGIDILLTDEKSGRI